MKREEFYAGLRLREADGGYLLSSEGVAKREFVLYGYLMRVGQLMEDGKYVYGRIRLDFEIVKKDTVEHMLANELKATKAEMFECLKEAYEGKLEDVVFAVCDGQPVELEFMLKEVALYMERHAQ